MSARNRTLALLGLLAAAACLRLFLISDKSTFVDEVLHITWAKGYEVRGFYGVKAKDLGITQEPRSLREAFAVAHRHNPPLHQTLLNLWMRTVGSDSDFALRSMYAVFSVLAVLAMYALGHLLYGPPGAFVAAALMALSPFEIYYAHEVNHYAPAVFFFAASLAALIAFIRSRLPVWAIAYVLSTTIACFGHYYVALSILGQLAAIATLLRRDPRALPRFGWLPLVPLALVALDRHAITVQMRDTTPEAFSGPFLGFGHVIHQTLVNVSWAWFGVLAEQLSIVFLVLGAALVALSAVASMHGRRGELEGRIVLFSACLPYAIIACGYLLTRKEQFLWPRYSIFASVAIYLLVADAVTRLSSHVWRACLAGAVVAAMLAGFVHYHARFQKQPWRQVADTMLRQGDETDPVIVYLPSLTYALGRYLRTRHTLYGIDLGDDLRNRLEAALSGARAAWLVLGWVQDEGVKEVIRSTIACRLPAQRDYAFHGLLVSRFTASAEGGAASCEVESGIQASSICVLDGSTPSIALPGWIEVRDGGNTVRLVSSNGTTLPVSRATGQPDGRIYFEAALRRDQLPVGRMVELWPEVVAPEGRVHRGRVGWRCLRRPDPAPAVPAASEQARGYLDSPVEYERLPSGAPIRVQGWVFSTRGIDRLSIAVDGLQVAQTRAHGAIREDVAAAFPDVGAAALFSGFDASGPALRGLGAHTLVVHGLRADGSVAWTSPARQVEVVERRDPEN